MPTQWNLEKTNACGTNVIVRCRDTVRWQENIFPLFGGIHYIEVSINGSPTVLFFHKVDLFFDPPRYLF